MLYIEKTHKIELIFNSHKISFILNLMVCTWVFGFVNCLLFWLHYFRLLVGMVFIYSSSLLFCTLLLTGAKELTKDEVDKVIEDDITQKLSEDLMQSIERKFQVDLERSVDMVLTKIKLLLQNGTTHIQDRLFELQGMLDLMRKQAGRQVDICLLSKQNQTSALAEKTLHQMVLCGYALIGQDPARAVANVVALKNMIKNGIKPIYSQAKEIDNLLKLCGHEHDSLKKVIKCVISKSPIIKSSMMDVTGKLIEGVVELKKQIAHGAMHEACLIEVVRTIEDEAFDLLNDIKDCVFGTNLQTYLEENNATDLDIKKKNKTKTIEMAANEINSDSGGMKELVRRMLADDNENDLDGNIKPKLQKELRYSVDNKSYGKSIKN